MSVKITLDDVDLKRALRTLGEKKLRTILSMSINASLRGTFTESKKVLQQKEGVKKISSIAKKIKIKNASLNATSGIIEFPDAGIGLENIKGTKIKKGKNGGVIGRGKKIPRSFPYKKILVQRTGSTAKPFTRLFGFTLRQSINKHGLETGLLQEKAETRMDGQFSKQLTRALKKLGF